MSEPATTVLLVDPDTHARGLLARQLTTIGCRIVQATDGPTALAFLRAEDVKLVVTELYIPTGDDRCLIQAIRKDKTLRKTRTLAHTDRSLGADREWAMMAGADAYLIKPTRAERMRYVVSRLATTRAPNASHAPRSQSGVVRRDSLDAALLELEKGVITTVSTTSASIVFGRTWWTQLSRPQQAEYRRRARKLRINLRSDSLMKNHYVEVRGGTRSEVALSTERPESPYRR